MKINLIKIPVSSISSAIKFYTDVLGFKVKFESEEWGWASIKNNRLSFALYVPGKGGGKGEPGKFDSLHLSVSQKTEMTKMLKAYQKLSPGTSAKIEKSADGLTFLELFDFDKNCLKIILQKD